MRMGVYVGISYVLIVVGLVVVAGWFAIDSTGDGPVWQRVGQLGLSFLIVLFALLVANALAAWDEGVRAARAEAKRGKGRGGQS